jgi:hypothetical protein
MSSKEKKANIAEEKLRNYIQKKYGKISSGVVNQSYEEWLKYLHETVNIGRIFK